MAADTSIDSLIRPIGTHQSTITTLKTIKISILEIYQKETAFLAGMNYERIEKVVSTSIRKPTPLPRDPEEPTRRSRRSSRSIACPVPKVSFQWFVTRIEQGRARSQTYPKTGATSFSATSMPSYAASALLSRSSSSSSSSSSVDLV